MNTKVSAGKPAVKRLLENTTEHTKDLHFVDRNKAPQSVSVPRATFDGDGKKVNGWVVIDPRQLETLQNNEVVAHYFRSGELVDGGEVADDGTSESTETDPE